MHFPISYKKFYFHFIEAFGIHLSPEAYEQVIFNLSAHWCLVQNSENPYFQENILPFLDSAETSPNETIQRIVQCSKDKRKLFLFRIHSPEGCTQCLLCNVWAHLLGFIDLRVCLKYTSGTPLSEVNSFSPILNSFLLKPPMFFDGLPFLATYNNRPRVIPPPALAFDKVSYRLNPAQFADVQKKFVKSSLCLDRSIVASFPVERFLLYVPPVSTLPQPGPSKANRAFQENHTRQTVFRNPWRIPKSSSLGSSSSSHFSEVSEELEPIPISSDEILTFVCPNPIVPSNNQPAVNLQGAHAQLAPVLPALTLSTSTPASQPSRPDIPFLQDLLQPSTVTAVPHPPHLQVVPLDLSVRDRSPRLSFERSPLFSTVRDVQLSPFQRHFLEQAYRFRYSPVGRLNIGVTVTFTSNHTGLPEDQVNAWFRNRRRRLSTSCDCQQCLADPSSYIQ